MQAYTQAQSRPKPNRKFRLMIGATALVLGLVCVGIIAVAPSAQNKIREISSNVLMQFGPARLQISLTASSSGGPVVGSLGSDLLQSDTWKMIRDYYKSKYNCTDVVNTQIKVMSEPGSSGAWEESWTVESCGKTGLVEIQYAANREIGGTDIHLGISSSAPAINGPVRGGRAEKFLKYHAWSAIVAAYAQWYRCADVASLKIEALNSPELKPGGTWTETWTVEACGKTMPLQLEFKPNSQTGDVDYTIWLHP